ncbi:hypothetical protein JCM11251_003667 [Rhodosporidiobolus azoricus]
MNNTQQQQQNSEPPWGKEATSKTGGIALKIAKATQRTYNQLCKDYCLLTETIAQQEKAIAALQAKQDEAVSKAESLTAELVEVRHKLCEATEKQEERFTTLEKTVAAVAEAQRSASSPAPASSSSSGLDPVSFLSIQEAWTAPLGPQHAVPVPACPTSYALAAARFPDLTEKQFLLFQRLPLPAANLVNDGSDLTKAVVRLYVSPLKKAPGFYKEFKDALWAMCIPACPVASMDFINTKEIRVTGCAILEMVIAAAAAGPVKRMLVKRLPYISCNATLLPSYGPSWPANPDFTANVRQAIKERYLHRMKLNTERKDAPLGVRRLFRQWYVQGRGKEDDLAELPMAGQQEEKGQEGAEEEGEVEGEMEGAEQLEEQEDAQVAVRLTASNQ